MLLSEGQMSDYKGAALMFDALPEARAMIADKGYDGDLFRQALTARGTVLASRQTRTARRRSRMMPSSTDSATSSRTCSASSRTGAASTPAMTAASTPSSPLPSSSGLAGNES